MRIQIVTCNSVYNNGKYTGGYHEIHEIDNLQNTDHIKATIKSVVTNHLSFKPNNSKLDMVIISGTDFKAIQDVIKYYEENSLGTKIVETETAYYS